ncbi:hypothetical protein [Mesoterricola silvestris]|nr:hypothetical protein [Mesoterricola silvestris]
MKCPLQQERLELETLPNGIQISVPARRSWFVLLFLTIWLCGWVMGERSALIEVFGHLAKPGPPPAFMAIWLTGWTVGGAFALLTLVWQVAGREIIGIESGYLFHKIQILGITRMREYQGDQIKRLRAVDYSPGFNRQASWVPPLVGQGVGPIAFDYGSKSVRIGQSLDEAEAPRLIELLVSRLPQSVHYS